MISAITLTCSALPSRPQPHHHDRQHLVADAVEQDRRGQLAQDDEEDQDPADREGRPRQRQQDAPERRPPRGAVHARALLEIVGELGEGARHRPHRQRCAQRHVGDQQRPQRPVELDGAGHAARTPTGSPTPSTMPGHHPRQPGQDLERAADRESACARGRRRPARRASWWRWRRATPSSSVLPSARQNRRFCQTAW